MDLLNHMKRVGSSFLKERHEKEARVEGCRIGFHEFNSQFHLHMHLMVEPIKPQYGKYKDRYELGRGLIPVDMVF